MAFYPKATSLIYTEYSEDPPTLQPPSFPPPPPPSSTKKQLFKQKKKHQNNNQAPLLSSWGKSKTCSPANKFKIQTFMILQRITLQAAKRGDGPNSSSSHPVKVLATNITFLAIGH
ncbi:hypothetical protein Fot_22293 [Forsythia ovata]|uniref:Uncharacterized protein n=1 Tax=Forsythia ovata TaxID=205694 RepID=A0ABD1UXB0_9LAMI